MEEEIKEACKKFRADILGIADRVNEVRGGNALFIVNQTKEPGYSEICANITLAYRHLEDARMRLGKAIQAIDGGTSVYDR